MSGRIDYSGGRPSSAGTGGLSAVSPRPAGFHQQHDFQPEVDYLAHPPGTPPPQYAPSLSRVDIAETTVDKKKREHQREMQRQYNALYTQLQSQQIKEENLARKQRQEEDADYRRETYLRNRSRNVHTGNEYKKQVGNRAQELERQRLERLLEKERREEERAYEWDRAMRYEDQVKKQEAHDLEAHRQAVLNRKQMHEEHKIHTTVARLREEDEGEYRHQEYLHRRATRSHYNNVEKEKRHEYARLRQEHEQRELMQRVSQKEHMQEEKQRRIAWCQEEIARDRANMQAELAALKDDLHMAYQKGIPL